MLTAGTRPHGCAHAGVLCRFNKDNELLIFLQVYAVQRGGGGWRHQGVASYLPALESASCLKLAWTYGHYDHRTLPTPYIKGSCGHCAREICDMHHEM